jgi:hypothetical protein
MRGKLARRGIILGGERCAELRAEGTGEHAYCTAEGSDMPQPQALVRPAQLPAVPAPTSSSEPEESRAADHEAPARHEDGQARGEALPESDHLQIPTPLENESDLPGGYLSDSSRESAARLLRPPPQAETQGTSPPGLLPSLVGQGGSPPLLVERGGSPPEGPSELASSGDGRSLLRPEALEALERHRKDTEGHPRGTLEKGNISERPDTLEGFSELREAASAGHTLAENTSLHRQMGRRTDRRIERCATSYAIQAAAPCIQTATLCVQAATLCVQAVAC